MAVTDAITRLIPGVITSESLDSESFNDGLLDYPNYTKPAEFRGMKVPDVLLSGHHENIKKYREEERIKRTKEVREDLVGGSNHEKD
jgi:tRNA (guanine37-N1)-methyltransferase